MHRLFDFSCTYCGHELERVVVFPTGEAPPRYLTFDCELCTAPRPHRRLLSTPARYLGDRVRNPCVTGGAFDTMGYAPVQTVPDLPADAEPTLDNYKALWSSKEWKDKRALQKEQTRKNVEKRKRAAALKAGGTVNMRTDKCAGDPKM